MELFKSKIGSQLFCFLLLICGGVSPTVKAQVNLPIEVMGAEGTQVSRTFSLTSDQVAATQRLWLQTHNIRYPEKASVQINGAAWVALNNTNATMLGTSNMYGGIGGSFAVLKMTLPISPGQLTTGNNTINFRFNVSNGLSVGYRIVNLNLLDSSGNRLMPIGDFIQENPATWQPPSSAPADIAAGENLWRNANLIANYKPGAASINAKCASCHTQNGADLKYFAYSINSIVERSKFHGLSEAQGNQIASYILSLSVKSAGRPWNPPYQPGPGITSKPNDEWLAGAGIENVLDEDADTLQSIFPNGVRRDAIMEGDSNKFKRYSTHDTPLAFQLPDWNHWLPEIHPVDAMPAYFATSKSLTIYNSLRSQLAGKTPAQISEWMASSSAGNPRSGMFTLIDFYGDSAYEFAEQEYPGLLTTDNTFADPAVARKIYSFVLWKMVKHVEIHEEFELTGLGKVPRNFAWIGYESRDALPRMWLGSNRSVFDSSPFLIHLAAPQTGSTSGSNTLNYRYISSAWYQLQLILNGGQRTGFNHQVVDWGYNWQFTSGMNQITNYNQVGRHYVWSLKGMDEGDNDRGPNQSDGWSFNRASLDPLLPYFTLENPGGPAISTFSRDALSLLFQVWQEKTNSWLPEQIFANPDGTLKSGNEDGFQFDTRAWVTSSGNNEYQSRSIGQGYYNNIAKFKAQNTLPPALLNGFAQWTQAVWPGHDTNSVARNNWLQFAYPRVGSAPSAPALANASTHGDIRVSWTPVAGVTSYNVKRSTTPGGPFLTVAYFRTSGQYTDSVPLTDREYYYKISANTGPGESPDSSATLSSLLTNRLLGTFIGTTPSSSDKIREAVDSDRHSIASAYTSGSWAGLDLGTAQSITRIGFVPDRAYSVRSIGGKFQASNSANFSSGVVDLYTISTDPGDGYEEQAITVPGTFRYVRYLIPLGGGDQGEIAEVYFFQGGALIVSAPVVAANQSASGTVNASFTYTIVASNTPTSFTLSAGALPNGITLNTTTGVISGTPTNTGTFNSSYTASNAGGTSPAVSLSIVISAAGQNTALAGTAIGTSGSWGGNSNATADKAFDGNTATFFDAAVADGAWTGLDLGTAKQITQIQYYPRAANPERMVGGLFQGSSTPDFSSNVVTLHTVSSLPPVAYTTVTITNTTTFRYVRYLAPAGGFGNVAEIQFYTSTGSPEAPTGLQAFRTSYGLDAGGSQDLLTPAGDGVQNLLKYAFNMIAPAPSTGQAAALGTPNSSVVTSGSSAGLPLVDVEGTGKLRVTYVRRKSTSNSGISYVVEFSDTLANGTWAANASATTTVTSIDATFERVVVTDSNTYTKRFVRLKIVVN